MVSQNSNFTFKSIEKQFRSVLSTGYSVLTCHQYYLMKHNLPEFCLINRIDVDLSVKKAEIIVDILNSLNIKATFFIRLHAPEYNVFSFENYRILKKIIETGHEIGLHTEVIDQSNIWKEDASKCLQRDIDVLQKIFDVKIFGCACHGGLTGFNNLDFFASNDPSDFGLLYEAYQNDVNFDLFHNSLYISDSEWHRWKCYKNGILQEGDRRSLGEHLQDRPNLIYSLIHPDSYFYNNIYE